MASIPHPIKVKVYRRHHRNNASSKCIFPYDLSRYTSINNIYITIKFSRITTLNQCSWNDQPSCPYQKKAWVVIQ